MCLLAVDCRSGDGEAGKPGGCGAENTRRVDGSGASERRVGRVAGRRSAEVSCSC